MLKHLIIISFLLSFIGCDGDTDKSVQSSAVKSPLPKDKASTQVETNNNRQPLDLEITPDMMGTVIETDKAASKQANEKPGLFDSKPVKKQDKISPSFKLYFDENETGQLNPEDIEGGKIEIEIVH